MVLSSSEMCLEQVNLQELFQFFLALITFADFTLPLLLEIYSFPTW